MHNNRGRSPAHSGYNSNVDNLRKSVSPNKALGRRDSFAEGRRDSLANGRV